MLAATTNHGFDRVDQKHRKTAKDDHGNDQSYPRVAMPNPPMWPEVLYHLSALPHQPGAGSSCRPVAINLALDRLGAVGRLPRSDRAHHRLSPANGVSNWLGTGEMSRAHTKTYPKMDFGKRRKSTVQRSSPEQYRNKDLYAAIPMYGVWQTGGLS